MEQYVPTLRQFGIEVEVSPFFDESAFAILYRQGHVGSKAIGVLRGFVRRTRDVCRARQYDLFLVHRESAPVGPALVERALLRMGIPYIYDFDDAIFLAPSHPANRRWAWLRAVGRLPEALRGARAVVVNNDYVAAWARQHNRNVTVIPTPVDTQLHRPLKQRDAAGPLTIGWVGSSTTSPYLRLVDDALAKATSGRDAIVRVIGGSYSHPGVHVEQREYRLVSEPADVAAFDVGILPEPDDEWTKGKGGFKALLYMAAGVPVVASRVGVNAELIGEAGVCVDGTEEWSAAISRLLDDPELRERHGRAGRDRVLRLYSVAVQAPRLAEVIRAAVRPC